VPWWGPLKKPTLRPTTPLIRSICRLFSFDNYECTRLLHVSLSPASFFSLRPICCLRPFCLHSSPPCACFCLAWAFCIRLLMFLRYARLRSFCLRPFSPCICFPCARLLSASFSSLGALVGPTIKTNIASNQRRAHLR
jgi:hypothetical protein